MVETRTTENCLHCVLWIVHSNREAVSGKTNVAVSFFFLILFFNAVRTTTKIPFTFIVERAKVLTSPPG